MTKVKALYPNAEAIVGVATGGIAIGALVADRLGLPFAYVRDKPKAHGRENTVEGFLNQDSKVVVIEDLISTGGSSLKAVESLRAYGVEVLGLLAIFTYNFAKADIAFEEASCAKNTLTSFTELISLIESNAIYSTNDIEYMKAWYQKGI